MMMQNYALAAAALLALCPLTAHAQAAPAPAATAQAVTLRLKFTPGRTLYYSAVTDTHSSSLGIPTTNHLEMLMHQAVETVRASDGAATIDVGIDSMTLSLNGQALPPPEKLAQMKSYATQVLLPNGETVSSAPHAAFGGAVPPELDMSHMNPLSIAPRLPDKPVRIGDTWKSADLPSKMGAQSAVFTLSGLETGGGRTVAVISQTNSGTFNMPGADGPMALKMRGKFKGAGTLRFDVDAGAVQSQTSRTDTTMAVTLPGAAAPMETQMTTDTTVTRAPAPAAGPAVR